MSKSKGDSGFALNGPREGKAWENLAMRLLWMVVISVMLGVAHTVLTFVRIIQFIIMLVAGRQPNESLVDFGATLGIWIAKATHYQTVASDVRPWPWSELA